MGVREKRFFRAVNRILKEELQKGNLPSSKEFGWRLDEYLSSQNLNRPEYQFRQTREGDTADAHSYNEVNKEIHNDLSTLYEGTIDIHNGLFKNFNKFEIEKSKLEYEMNELENRLKNFILLSSENGLLGTVHEVFDDMNKINVERSDAHIDIKKHYASIPSIRNTSRRIQPDAHALFAISPDIRAAVESIPISGVPSSALSESENESWQHLVLSKAENGIIAFYQVDFEKLTTMNRIEVEMHGSKPTKVKIDCSPDGTNWMPLPYHEIDRLIGQAYAFDFPTIEIKKIRMRMEKNEPDDRTETQNFIKKIPAGYNQFIFGMKSINFHMLDYPPQALFVSEEMTVDSPEGENFTINKVSLSVDEDIPPATDIKYSIALPPKGLNEPQWRYISPVERENPRYDSVIDFRNITNAPPERFSIDSNTSLTEYEMESLYANGIKFYRLGRVPDKKIISQTERLFPGRNAWGMQRFTFRHDNHEQHIPSISDWEERRSITHSFKQIEDGKPGTVLSGEKANAADAYNYMFTAGILSEKRQTVEAAAPVSTEPIAVYVNGQEVYRGKPNSRTRIPYEFNYGWNEVIVLVYIRNVGAANGATVDINIDMRNYGANVYAQAQPMELVSLHDLRYNTKSNERTKYAIEVVNDESHIVLNHAMPDMEYDFFFHYAEGEIMDKILLRAEFSKNEQHSSISPKLNSYRLRFS